MKRLFFKLIMPVIALLAVSQQVSAQWSGTNPLWTNYNVGYGTSAPAQRIHVKAGNALLDYANGTGGGSNLYFGGVTNSSQNGMRLSFYNSTGAAFKNGYIDVRTTGGTANDGLLFRVDGGIGSTEQMRICANGNVGIGTAAPGNKLQVNAAASANNAIVKFSDSDGRRIFFAPKLGTSGYNNLSLANDAGLFWSDNSGANTASGSSFVIAPHENSHWAGLRLAADGKVIMPGYNATVGNGLGKIGLGKADGLAYGTSYLGFNAVRSETGGTWSFDNDGANNGGNVIWGDVGGRIRFSTEASTGAINKTRSDAQMVAQTKMSIGPDGKVTIGDDTNTGVIDLNFGQIASGEGIGSKRTSGGNQWGLDFYTAGANRMRIDNNGKVVIGPLGTTTPGTYGLYVRNGILTEHMTVAIYGSSSWPDYVFEPDYKLPKLEDVEAYIQKEKHLPNVPSAQEMVDKGLDVATTDAMLLRKIEEITLYLIEVKKENAALKQAIETLQNQQK